MGIAKKISVFALAACTAGALFLTGCAGAPEEETPQPVQEPQAESVELQIFAANSLQKALDEVQDVYVSEHPEVTFADTQYKGSGDLVKDMQGGAPCDVLITASKSTMDTAVEDGLVDEATRFDMFTNDLVIVTGAGNASIPEGITLDQAASGEYTLALGNDNVPAGNYARQSLSTIVPVATEDGLAGKETSGKVGSVEGEGFAGTVLAGKIVSANTVGDACNYAATGDADLAFVYTSDVARYQDKVTQAGVVDAGTHKNIVYPAALAAQSEKAQACPGILGLGNNRCAGYQDLAEVGIRTCCVNNSQEKLVL